jgi:flagellar biosynthesis activator protein FlaF
MYQFSYAEILEDDTQGSRNREREALDHAIELLKLAMLKGRNSRESIEALHYVRKLWIILIEDLANPENDLPDVLKADLINVGIWITKESDLISIGRSENFEGLIDICGIVRDGLK